MLFQVFPPVSKLDPDVYGPPESAIKEEHIIGQLNGMSIQQVILILHIFKLSNKRKGGQLLQFSNKWSCVINIEG
jgi:Lipoxygenase